MGGFSLIKWLTRSQPKAIMYHRFCDSPEGDKVSADIFDRQMQVLKNGFNVIHMSQACEELNRNNKLPANTIVLTIDDGYRDFYKIAYPILKKYDLSATIYITTGFIDRKTWLWPDIISYIIDQCTNNSIYIYDNNSNKIYLSLKDEDEKSKSWHKLIRLCISMSDTRRRELISRIIKDVDVKVPKEPVEEYQPMTWDDIYELSCNNIEIGAHTINHPILSKLDKNELEFEVSGAKSRIEKIIGKPVSSFCYPNGQPGDLNDAVKSTVIRSGYSSAAVAYHDNQGWLDVYEIRRYSSSNSMYQFKKAVFGSQLLAAKFEGILN